MLNIHICSIYNQQGISCNHKYDNPYSTLMDISNFCRYILNNYPVNDIHLNMVLDIDIFQKFRCKKYCFNIYKSFHEYPKIEGIYIRKLKHFCIHHSIRFVVFLLIFLEKLKSDTHNIPFNHIYKVMGIVYIQIPHKPKLEINNSNIYKN